MDASTGERDRVDRCPGALALHEAADGFLARVRMPGGELVPGTLTGLADVAERYGSGVLELTSRGNVQVRGVTDPAALAAGVAGLGLLPSATHERVRNVVASPLAGLDRPGPRLGPLVRALDAGLLARPALAGLPGRFLFGLDDGRGDVLALGPDVAGVVAGDRWRVEPAGVEVGLDRLVPALLATAEAFLDLRGSGPGAAWRVAELPGGPAALASLVRPRLAARLAPGPPVEPAPPREPVGQAPSGSRPVPPAEPVGAVRQVDGRWAVTVLAPLGRLTGDQARLLDGSARRVTPWRSVVAADLPDPAPLLAAARAAGLGVDAGSRWYGLTACTGRPGCAAALADVRADAAAAPPAGGRTHWSGCARRCGHPSGPYRDVLATGAGYEVRSA